MGDYRSAFLWNCFMSPISNKNELFRQNEFNGKLIDSPTRFMALYYRLNQYFTTTQENTYNNWELTLPNHKPQGLPVARIRPFVIHTKPIAFVHFSVAFYGCFQNNR